VQEEVSQLVRDFPLNNTKGLCLTAKELKYSFKNVDDKNQENLNVECFF